MNGKCFCGFFFIFRGRGVDKRPGTKTWADFYLRGTAIFKVSFHLVAVVIWLVLVYCHKFIMSQRLWLLVEWVDERNVFSHYGVVNADSLVTNESDLHTGKMVFIRNKHGNGARRAQILRISGI